MRLFSVRVCLCECATDYEKKRASIFPPKIQPDIYYLLKYALSAIPKNLRVCNRVHKYAEAIWIVYSLATNVNYSLFCVIQVFQN